MALIDDVKQICDRLAPLGWGALLQWHGLNIAAADLAGELERPLTGIWREIAGFADFHVDTTRGVEPGGSGAQSASNVFQPGWDSSLGQDARGTFHTAYGLGDAGRHLILTQGRIKRPAI